LFEGFEPPDRKVFDKIVGTILDFERSEKPEGQNNLVTAQAS